MSRSLRKLLSASLATSMVAAVGFSACAEEQKSAEEIAAELANPNTVLGTMNFNIDYTAFDGDLPGAGDQSGTRITFQPSLPYPLGDGVNLFARPAIPIIIKQDVPTQNGWDDPGFNLGDIGFDVGIGKTLPGGIIAIGGVVGTLPTATDDKLGKDQWALGPEALLAVVRKWGALGLLVTHQWDVAGEDDFDTNVTAGQYFYVFNLSDGWQIRSGPTYAYDHEAPAGQRWTVPIGFGVNKTTIINGTPWKFGIEYWHYVEQADAFGPDFQIRFSFAPVVPLPW
ncbi:hypothetical protein [Colwellia sp. MEBiC06753]